MSLLAEECNVMLKAAAAANTGPFLLRKKF